MGRSWSAGLVVLALTLAGRGLPAAEPPGQGRTATPKIPVILDTDIGWRHAGDPAAKDPATASSVLFDTVAIHLARSSEWLRMEELPIVVSDDGFTRIDSRGKPVNCAMAWTDKAAFDRFLVDRLTGGQ